MAKIFTIFSFEDHLLRFNENLFFVSDYFDDNGFSNLVEVREIQRLVSLPGLLCKVPQWRAFTTRWQYWSRMKSFCFYNRRVIFFSKQNETSFIRAQYRHLADDGSPLQSCLITKMLICTIAKLFRCSCSFQSTKR